MRAGRWLMLTLALLPRWAAAQELELVVPDAGAGERIVGAPLDVVEFDALYPDVDPARLTARLDDGTPLATQYDRDLGAPWDDGGRGRISVLLPAGAAGRRVRLVHGEPAAAPETGLRVSQDGGRIVVENRTYAVTHDPAEMGGLPSSIELRPSGKVFDSYSLNDRLYDRELGGFDLRNDKEPQVELLAAGPLQAVVRVRARYLKADGQATPSNASAVYDYVYTAGSPQVVVRGFVQQDDPFAWGQLHFIEINYPDEAFGRYVAGPPLQEGEFTAERKSVVKSWAALVDDAGVVGMTGGSARLYDGRGEYGTYLHGPWLEWSDRRRTLESTLYLSGEATAKDDFVAAAQSSAPVSTAWLVPNVIADNTAAMMQRAEALPVAEARALRWARAVAERFTRSGEWVRARNLTNLLAPVDGVERQAEAVLRSDLGWKTLAGEQLGAAFEQGMLVSLYDMAADRELLAGPEGLWRLHLGDTAQPIAWYGPAEWRGVEAVGFRPEREERDADGELTMIFRDQPVALADGPVPGPTVTARYRLEGPRLTVHLAVDNETPLSVWQAVCPTLSPPPLGGDPGDDRLFTPQAAGVVDNAPATTGLRWSGRYPQGWCSMQYMALYDDGGGLYIATHDPVAAFKHLDAGPPEPGARLPLGLRWEMPNQSLAGNDWTMTGEGTLAVFNGDWYDASQIYRGWAEAEARWWPARAKTRPTPASFEDIAVWVLTGGHPYEPTNVVRDTKAFAEYMGVPTAIHWYNWHEIGFDDDYPHYDPTKPRVAEGTAELEAAGIRVMPYINARLWDTELQDFIDEAVRYATMDLEGKPYIEVYGSKVPLAPMCPVTEFWQDKVREIVLWIQEDVGTSGVYMDQVAAAAPRLCFNPDHGHPLGGGHWWTEDGYWPLLDKLRSAMGPDKFITTECNAEPYMQYYDGYLTWHWQRANQVPAFSAVYSDQVLLFSRAYRGGPTRDLAHRQKAAQSLVYGEQIGWVSPKVINEPSGPFIRACAQMRHALRHALSYGRMLRPPLLRGDIPELTADWQWSGETLVTLPAIQAGAWRAPDGRTVLLFANFSPEPVTADVELDEAPAAGTKWLADGQGEVRRMPGTWTGQVTVPAEAVIAYEYTNE